MAFAASSVAVDGDEHGHGVCRPVANADEYDSPVRSLDEDGKALMTFESAQSLVVFWEKI